MISWTATISLLLVSYTTSTPRHTANRQTTKVAMEWWKQICIFFWSTDLKKITILVEGSKKVNKEVISQLIKKKCWRYFVCRASVLDVIWIKFTLTPTLWTQPCWLRIEGIFEFSKRIFNSRPAVSEAILITPTIVCINTTC